VRKEYDFTKGVRGKWRHYDKRSYPIPLMTVTEVAAWLRVKRQTLYKWVWAKKIPHIKFSKHGKLLFRRSDLEKWLNEKLKRGAE
jgi:excisionase family DNA binding protein